MVIFTGSFTTVLRDGEGRRKNGDRVVRRVRGYHEVEGPEMAPSPLPSPVAGGADARLDSSVLDAEDVGGVAARHGDQVGILDGDHAMAGADGDLVELARLERNLARAAAVVLEHEEHAAGADDDRP
jgi:hypothetical protein